MNNSGMQTVRGHHFLALCVLISPVQSTQCFMETEHVIQLRDLIQFLAYIEFYSPLQGRCTH